MRRFLILTALFHFIGGMICAENTEGPIFGPNKLRNNNNLTMYHESEKGIPIYVEGVLSDQKSPGGEFEAALAFFEEHRGAYRMVSPSDELRLKVVQTDDLEMRHVRLEQLYKGVPVIGGELIAHFSSSNVLQTVNGYYHHDIDLDVTASVTKSAAVDIASADLVSFFGEADPDDPQLVVFPWEGEYYLCWRLFLFSDTPMGRWEYFIDAKTGDIVYNANRIMNENDIGTGYGVMGDLRDHIDTHLEASNYAMKDFTRRADNNPHGHDGQMPAGNSIQTNIAGGSLPGSVATDADNFWDDPSSQRPAVDGHVYTCLVYDWMLALFDRNGFDDNGASMLTSVNYYAEGDNNAYWNGNQIVVWSWSTGWRSLAGCPDVIAHEWGHAVTDYCSNLVYQKEPGALNESFSDMMGAAFEFAHPEYDTPDWFMGENGQISGSGFRSMDDPHMFGDPDFYGPSDPYWVDVINCTPSWTNDYCGVHTNSGVGNKWFSLLSDGGTHHDVTVVGIGVDNAMKIAYRANHLYWNSQTDYHEGALGTISAATDLDPTGAWTTEVANAWNAVGVSTPGPSLVFTFPDGVPSILPPETPRSFEVLIQGTLGGEMVANSGYLHYSLDGAPYVDQPLQEMSSTRFKATLPGAVCGSIYEFYISAEETSTGIKYDTDPDSPHRANVADSVITLFADDCETDQGWTVSGNASDGQWERGIPVGGGDRGDPPTDYDGSGYCYLTDNVDDNSDVDNGTTYLDSPIFDLSGGDAEISYARWYSNDYGAAPNSDIMRIYLSNNAGGNWTQVDSAGPTEQASGGWYEHSFWSGDFLAPTDQMMLRFEASDLGEGSVVEAGLDAVSVVTYSCGSTPEPLEITTESVPDWTAGYPYSVQLNSTGGIGVHIWADKYGDLFGTGLSLSVEGLLSGTVPEGMVISFTAEVTDEEDSTDEAVFTFTINDALSITTTSLPDWTEGVPYSELLASDGGTGGKTWLDKYADLIGTGLSLNASGLVSGTPTPAGPISFTAEVTDQVGASAETVLSFTVNPAPDITTAALPEAGNGEPYSSQLEVTGGTGIMTWTDRDGDLSGTGLTLAADGLLSGTPVDTGTIDFTARVVDAVGGFDEQALSLSVVQTYVCGDANGDTDINIADAVHLVNYVFKDGPAPDPLEAGDANCDGEVNVADGVWIINFVFKDGPEPCCP